MLCIFLCTQVSYGQKDISSTTKVQSIFDQFMVYRHQNKVDKALETLDEAAKIAENNEDAKLLLDTYHQYARLFLEEGDRETTIFYWDRASILLKDLSYSFGQAFHNYLEAAVRFDEGNNFQSLKLLEESRKLSNNRNLSNNILLLEAYIYTNIEKYEDAIKNLHALIVNSDDKERPYLATKANLQLAKISLQLNDLEEGIIHSKAALELAEKHDYSKEIRIANERLSIIYERIGSYDESLRYKKSLEQIKDSIFNIEKVKLESKTADRIRFEHQMTEINKLTAKNEELSESKNRSEITAILTSAFLTIISLLAVSLFRNNQIKLKTNDLLYTKNKELELARDSAVSAMEAKTNFLSTVTHELRTPLYAVTGLTHLLLDENPAEHQKEHLRSLKFSGDYLLNFINDILQINKIDADKLEPLNIEFKLHKVLADVVDSLQQNASENNTTLVLDYDPKIPQHLLGDPIKLSQIFMNLMGNALKFTKDGKVEVIAKLLNKDEENVKLYFEVKDNGIGISEDQQKNIFDSFEQGSVQINREYGGTGLGLTIVKSLLGLFNSKINLESELGHGSSFFFEMDIKCDANALNEVSFELNPEEFEFKGLHILIVEDNKINQVITKKMLTKKEITCDIANNGNEAIDMAKANTYDAILMDIHMPGISGEEATRQIRKFDQEIPIIALTAISLDDSLDSFYEAGCNDVVTKPFKPEVFYQKIGENIFRKKMEGQV
ncbi:hybrid sensor histidine kinase/response regulator [Flagellimonas aquimarina]|jgi:signal transduction histidine kinase/CheY-like chemotaxis protein|uniref:histidine kinase n=1 Tax=Flagellimonas aquimarina TaxID=2201895 RepID=A0A316KXE1_9FLAO|nr:response regulator [Allomuricauda koreensis]PWL37475.1 hybrid sensor histidine kinase/response regulator [Allomuricauda koreensis]